MKEIPSQLQCAYCIRNSSHGGECTGKKSAYDVSGCLIFKADEKGCIRSGDFRIRIGLYQDFPLLNTWCNYWQLNSVDTEIRVKRIYGFKWDTKTGELIVHCNCDYYINEYHDDYKEPKQRPNLQIVR